ncbi:MAG: hypothetical protein ACHQ9S_00525 [Candidatus Binatia bacterium]
MMPLRHCTIKRVRVLFIIALAFVPLALSGHFHTTTQRSAPDSCAACVVTHHSRTANLSPLPVTAPVLHSTAVVVSIAAAPAHVSLPFKTGRAPPVLFLARVA